MAWNDPVKPTTGAAVATNRTEADAVGEIAQRAVRPKLMTIDDGVEVFVAPANIEPRSIKKFIDEYADAPDRRSGTAALRTLDSFVEHVNRHKDTDSVLFATEENTRLVCVFDYNRAGPEGPPRFGKHRAHYDCPLSDEWAAWDEADDETLDATAFAELIETRIGDVVDPSTVQSKAKQFASILGIDFAGPSKIMELSRGVALRVNSKVARTVNLSSGETQFQFEEAHADEAGAPLKVPGAFLIQIPVFKGGPLYQLPVRLRYRVRDRSIAWTVSMYRADLALQHAFTEVCDAAKERTALPLFYGTPE